MPKESTLSRVGLELAVVEFVICVTGLLLLGFTIFGIGGGYSWMILGISFEPLGIALRIGSKT